jgi:hypothetical protein
MMIIAFAFAVFVIVTVWIPLMVGFLMIEGFNTGVVRARSAKYSRVTHPRWFWAVIAVNGGVVLMFCYVYFIAGRMVFAQA